MLSIFFEYEFKMRKRREAGKDKWQRLTSCPCFVMPVGVKLIRPQSNSTNHGGFSVVWYLRKTCRGMIQGLRFLFIAVKPGKGNVLGQECTNPPRIQKPPQNSRRHMGDMKQVPRWEPKNARRYHIKSILIIIAKEMHCYSSLFWQRTLHVSDRSTVHHRESQHCIHMFHPDLASRQST
jgi:hypothetical protein